MKTVVGVLQKLTLSVLLALAQDLPLVCGSGSLSYDYERVYPPVDSNSNTSHIYIGLIVSFGKLFNSSANVPGVRLALDLINSDPDMLRGYTLHYVLSDSQCNRTVASRAFLEQMLNPPTKLGLIGAGCSVATEPVAEISSYFNISHLSCSTASDALSNRQRFPNYFQLLPTIADIAPVYDVLAQEFNWKHLAFIVENVNLFTVKFTTIQMFLKKRNVTHTQYLFDSSKGLSSLENSPFNDSDDRSRIFIAMCYEQHALDILCEAAKYRFKYPDHLLITYRWYKPGWWNSSTANCTLEERQSVLSNSLAVNFIADNLLFSITSTAIGINGTEYYQMENDVRGMFGGSVFSQYCFDATFAFAFALNSTLNEFSSNDHGASILANFSYSSDFLFSKMYKYLEQGSFPGITGNVSFNENGVRIANLLSVHQFQNIGNDTLSLTEVGLVTSTPDNTFKFQYRNKTSLWPDGVPNDGVIKRDIATVSVYVSGTLDALASVGVLFTLACLLFNFLLRKRKLIRISSPNLNYFIIIGCLLYYADVYFYTLPVKTAEIEHIRCTVTIWLTPLAYSFSFGPIIAKMFRVWFIFNRLSVKNKVIHDWKLALSVLALVGIDILILTIFNALRSNMEDALTRIPIKEIPESKAEDVNIPVIYEAYVCKSLLQDVIIGVLFGYKVLIQVAALLMAFMTRKVKVKGLNDAKFIAAIIYITSIVQVVILVCFYTLRENVTIFAAVISIGLLINATGILGLVFIPKMIGLIKDPAGEYVFQTNPTSTVIREPSKAVKSNDPDLFEETTTITSLKSRIKELEEALKDQNNGTNCKEQSPPQ